MYSEQLLCKQQYCRWTNHCTHKYNSRWTDMHGHMDLKLEFYQQFNVGIYTRPFPIIIMLETNRYGGALSCIMPA